MPPEVQTDGTFWFYRVRRNGDGQMTRTPIITGLLAASGALSGALAGPVDAWAQGSGTTIYNNYGDAVYYTTINNVSHTTNTATYSPGGVYVPANYPANFAHPRVAPAAYGVAYQRPVYATPVYSQPVYTQPVYAQPFYGGVAYVEPVRRAGGHLRIGHSKTYHHRKVRHTRKVGHRTVRVSHRPTIRVRGSAGHRSHSWHHRPHQVRHRSGLYRGHHRDYRPQRGHHHRPHGRGVSVSFGRRR